MKRNLSQLTIESLLSSSKKSKKHTDAVNDVSLSVTRVQTESASGSGTSSGDNAETVTSLSEQTDCAQTGTLATEESTTSADASDGWPSLWLLEQRLKFCEKYPWLFPNQGKIGK
jgi:hypothetical protein